MIELRTVGETTILLHRQPLSPDADVLFGALVFLTAERGRLIQRQRLSSLLWPDSPPAAGRRLLRQLLYRLHRLGVPIEADRHHLVLPTDFVATTFSAAPSEASLADDRAAGTLRLGRWLPGYEPAFGAEYTAWLDDHRARMELEFCRTATLVMQQHRARGEWTDVEYFARSVLELDPLREEVVIALAEALAMRGVRADALGVLDTFLAELTPDDDQRRAATHLRQRVASHVPAPRYERAAEPELVGRAHELAQLTGMLANAQSRSGGLVVLSGAPGMGKSRLARHVADAARIRRVRVRSAECDESDQHRPMALFATLLPQLLELPGALACSPTALSLLRQLTESVDGCSGGGEGTADPHAASRVRSAVGELIDVITAEVTLLLVIDDAHWMDDASLSVLHALHRRSTGQALMVLLTSSVAPAESGLGRFTPSSRCIHLALPPLSDDDASHVLAQVARTYAAPWCPQCQRWCLELGEGNPQLLQDLARHRIEQATHPAQRTSPHTIIDARIASLTSAARRVLQAVAVLGSTCTVERLGRVLEMPSYMLATAIDELCRRRIVCGVGTTLRVRHELFAQRALGGIAPPALALLHRRAARAIERGARGERPVCAKTQLACAYHWLCAGDAERTTRALKSAVHQLIEHSHTMDAIRWLESAPHLGGEVTDLARLLRQGADAPPLLPPRMHAAAER